MHRRAFVLGNTLHDVCHGRVYGLNTYLQVQVRNALSADKILCAVPDCEEFLRVGPREIAPVYAVSMIFQPVTYLCTPTGRIQENTIRHAGRNALTGKHITGERQPSYGPGQGWREKRFDFINISIHENFLENQICQRFIIC